MPSRYSAAVIGCGDIGHAHVAGYRLNPEVELVAVADPVKAARRQFQLEYQIPKAYGSATELFSELVPDIVSVCVWHPLHAQLTVLAANARVKAVICEKPMATSLGDADEMIAACEEAGTKLVVSHQRRFTPGWEAARSLIAAGELGALRAMRGSAADGLLNGGTHVIDGLRFLAGDPEPLWVIGALERRTNRYERDTPIEDWAVLFCELAGGIQMLVESDIHGWGGQGGILLHVEGENGVVEATERWAAVLGAGSKGWQSVVDLEHVDAVGGQANRRLVAELLGWLEGGPEHRCSARVARPATEVMMAAYESARRHCKITLPLEETGFPLELMVADGSLVPEGTVPYDIRSYLRRELIDEERYAELRAKGVSHRQIMQTLGGTRLEG
jgi:UDP-N-acetyl-2-amino-2-deoxyglucuronate dehydrogenase